MGLLLYVVGIFAGLVIGGLLISLIVLATVDQYWGS